MTPTLPFLDSCARLDCLNMGIEIVRLYDPEGISFSHTHVFADESLY